jgi:hypothetical protein
MHNISGFISVLESPKTEQKRRRQPHPKFGPETDLVSFFSFAVSLPRFPTLTAATTGRQIYPSLFLSNLRIALLLKSLKTHRITAWFLRGRVFKFCAETLLQKLQLSRFSVFSVKIQLSFAYTLSCLNPVLIQIRISSPVAVASVSHAPTQVRTPRAQG